jgi:hypothetical protein
LLALSWVQHGASLTRQAASSPKLKQARDHLIRTARAVLSTGGGREHLASGCPKDNTARYSLSVSEGYSALLT